MIEATWLLWEEPKKMEPKENSVAPLVAVSVAFGHATVEH